MARKKKQDVQRKYPNLGNITVPFGGKTKYENTHPGVDISNVKGTTVKSPVNGVVERAVSGKQNGDNGFGNLAVIVDREGNRHQLAHFKNLAVKPGDRVRKGATPVGSMGNSGSAYSLSGEGDGTHLDYRIATEYGKWKNPMTYVKNLGR